MVRKLHNDIEAIYHRSRFLAFSRMNAPRFEMRHKRTLEQLAPLVSHRNVVEASRSELCSVLGTTDKNLNRHLKKVDHLIRIWSARNCDPEHPVPEGILRLEIAPSYVWRDDPDMTRERAVRLWYALETLGGADGLSGKDVYVSGAYAEQFGNAL